MFFQKISPFINNNPPIFFFYDFLRYLFRGRWKRERLPAEQAKQDACAALEKYPVEHKEHEVEAGCEKEPDRHG